MRPKFQINVKIIYSNVTLQNDFELFTLVYSMSTFIENLNNN